MNNLKKQLFFNLIVVAVLLVLFTFFLLKYSPRIITTISNPIKFKELLVFYGSLSIFVFIFFQIISVILAPIPSELLLIAGGYIYGPIFGVVYSISGIFIGSIIVFFISRVFGFNLIKVIVPSRRFQKFDFLMNSPKSQKTMFFLYLIPEVPKDIITYIAGLTPVNPVKFIIMSTIARLPCVVGSSYIGANLGIEITCRYRYVNFGCYHFWH